MKRILFLCLATLLSSNSAFAKEINQFIGKWSVNVDRTFEAAKTAQKFKPETEEENRRMLVHFAGTMQLELTESLISFIRGKSKEEISYIVKSSAPSSFIAEATPGDRAITLSFYLQEGKYLNIKSSVSDDMDFFIWEKTADDKGVDSEFKVITNILSDQLKSD